MVIRSDPTVRIFAEIDEEHSAITSLVASLPLDMISSRKGGHWSAIDLLTHLTVWQAKALEIARQQAQPDAAPLDPAIGPGRVLGLDTDAHNAETLAERRAWTLDQALAWYNQVYADLRLALAEVPASRLLGGPGPHGAQMWYARPALLHSRGHRQEFEQRIGMR
jgi:hypothetical protein